MNFPMSRHDHLRDKYVLYLSFPKDVDFIRFNVSYIHIEKAVYVTCQLHLH